MSAVVIGNSLEGEKQPQIPTQENGEFYPYIMYFSNNSRIAYADTVEDLLELLIDGYKAMSEDERLYARLKLAKQLQSSIFIYNEAAIADEDEDFVNLKDWEKKCLTGRYNDTQSYLVRDFWKENLPEGTKPEDVPEDDRLDIWFSDVPLVLIDAAYEPWSDVPRPLANPANTNIIYLAATDPLEFLTSLSQIGYIAFGEVND